MPHKGSVWTGRGPICNRPRSGWDSSVTLLVMDYTQALPSHMKLS